MAKVIALTPVNHDGVEYQEGAEFDVASDEQVAALVEAGAAEVKQGKAKKAEPAAE